PVNRDDADDHIEVALTCQDGRTCRRAVRFTRGDPRGGEPLGWDEVLAKYTDCAGSVLNPDAVTRSATLIRGLADLVELSDLTEILRGDPAG
ncbi:MAG TPA: hypothetical protein VGL80_33260, partial [Pseudonocardiaceae bacterium]